MANFVIKKDGTKEPFAPEKIKSAIMSAASQAGVQEEEARGTADRVSASVADSILNIEEIPSAELRARILSTLDATSPDISQAWKKYEAEKEEKTKNEE